MRLFTVYWMIIIIIYYNNKFLSRWITICKLHTYVFEYNELISVFFWLFVMTLWKIIRSRTNTQFMHSWRDKRIVISTLSHSLMIESCTLNISPLQSIWKRLMGSHHSSMKLLFDYTQFSVECRFTENNLIL